MSKREDAAARGRRTKKSPHPSAWARWRVGLRLARRQVWRTRGSSVLVVALVALPVMALAGGAVVWQSHQPTPAQQVQLQLGRNQAWLQIAGGADPSRYQAIDSPDWNDVDRDDQGNAVHPQPAAPTDVAAAVPAGTRTIEVTTNGTVYVKTATGIGQVQTVTGPVWDDVFAGRWEVLSGRAAASDDDVMVSPGLRDRLGTQVGGQVTLPDAHRTFTITGTMRELDQDPSLEVLYLPSSAKSLVAAGNPQWFVPDWQPDYVTLQDLNHDGYVAYARDLVEDPPDGALVASRADTSQLLLVISYGAIVVAFGGYLVVLLAGAAFAVAARRQQRSLAVAASVGAGRGDVFRVVLLQGSVLGLAGGLIGTVIGVALASALLAVTDRGVLGTFWGNWGVKVPWLILIGVALFSIVVGTCAAIAPARGATRGDVLGALRGSRRPAKLNPHRPWWGLGLMILGVAATAVGALGTVALNKAVGPDANGALHAGLIVAMVIGPLVFQIGMILAGHWTMSQISRVLSRLSLPARVASRDAAANPSRVVPAFAAIAACVFIASFALELTAMVAHQATQSYAWDGHPGVVSVGMYGPDLGEHPDEYIRAAQGVVAGTRATATALAWSPVPPATDAETGELTDDAATTWSVAPQAHGAPGCESCDPRYQLAQGPQLAVLAADDLQTVLGPVPRSALNAYRHGTGLVVTPYVSMSDADDHVTVVTWKAAALEEYNDEAGPSGPNGSWPDPASLPTPEKSAALPITMLHTGYPQGYLQLVISPETATRLGIAVQPASLSALYPKTPSSDVVDAMTQTAANTRVSSNGGLTVHAEYGPSSFDPVLWLIVAATGILVFGAGSVCLGLARFERRPDDATLSAVGAGRRLRRGVSAWQAAIIVGVGTIVGTIAGSISAWGFVTASSDLDAFSATPWLWLGFIAVGLPVVMAVASWLIPPRHADLTHRTVIA